MIEYQKGKVMKNKLVILVMILSCVLLALFTFVSNQTSRDQLNYQLENVVED